MARQTVTRRRSNSAEAETETRATTPAEEPKSESSRRGSRRERVAEAAKVGAGEGWDAYAKVKANTKTKSYVDTKNQLKVEDDPVLVKFPQAGPFETYNQHWVQRGKGKKRSWTCPEGGKDAGCDLCLIEDYPRFLALFNVVVIDGDKHEIKYWQCGKNASDQVEEMAKSKRYSPINDDDLYFEVIRKEKDVGYEYKLVPLRASELDDAELVTADELAKYELFVSDDTTVEPVDWKGLTEVADEVVAKGDK